MLLNECLHVTVCRCEGERGLPVPPALPQTGRPSHWQSHPQPLPLPGRYRAVRCSPRAAQRALPIRPKCLPCRWRRPPTRANQLPIAAYPPPAPGKSRLCLHNKAVVSSGGSSASALSTAAHPHALHLGGKIMRRCQISAGETNRDLGVRLSSSPLAVFVLAVWPYFPRCASFCGRSASAHHHTGSVSCGGGGKGRAKRDRRRGYYATTACGHQR